MALKKLQTLGRSSLYAVGCSWGRGTLLEERFTGFVSCPADEVNFELWNFLFLRASLQELVKALCQQTKNQGALSRSRYFQIGSWVFSAFLIARLMLAWIECSYLMIQSCFDCIDPFSRSFRSRAK